MKEGGLVCVGLKVAHGQLPLLILLSLLPLTNDQTC